MLLKRLRWISPWSSSLVGLASIEIYVEPLKGYSQELKKNPQEFCYPRLKMISFFEIRSLIFCFLTQLHYYLLHYSLGLLKYVHLVICWSMFTWLVVWQSKQIIFNSKSCWWKSTNCVFHTCSSCMLLGLFISTQVLLSDLWHLDMSGTLPHFILGQKS